MRHIETRFSRDCVESLFLPPPPPFALSFSVITGVSAKAKEKESTR
jgi:hypothetical protein